MKKIILILAAGLMGFQVMAQTSAEPFKKANTIILQTTKTDSANYIQFQRELMKFDYSIKKSNKELMTVSTDLHALKTHPNWDFLYFFRIQFIGNNIVIKPYWKKSLVFLGSADFMRWHYTNSRINVLYPIWVETLELLNDYGGTVIYEKR